MLAVIDGDPPGTGPEIPIDAQRPEGPLVLPGILHALGAPPEIFGNAMAVRRHCADLARTSAPSQYTGDLVLFVGGDGETPSATDADLQAWQPLVAGDIRVHALAARHGDLLKPDAAARIGKALDRELAHASDCDRVPAVT